MTVKPSPPIYSVGDKVEIAHSELRGRIVELRGPLAPGGVQVYRIRYRGKPRPAYIEVREDQVVLIRADSNGTAHPG